MEIVAAAAKDHGSGIIIHNDAQHFSAGVDLNAFRKLIEDSDWNGIDRFLSRFQKAVCVANTRRSQSLEPLRPCCWGG